MGTDIHLAVEVRRDIDIAAMLGDGFAETTALAGYRPWLMVGNDGFSGKGAGGVFPKYPGHGATKEQTRAYWESDPGGRDYNLFAFLADVRNGRGFAGSYRHEPVGPQFPDRGLPADIDAGMYGGLDCLLEWGAFKPTTDHERDALRILQANMGEIIKAAKAARDPRSTRVLQAIIRLREGATTDGERSAAKAAEARWRARWFPDGEHPQVDEDDEDDDKCWIGDHSFTWASFTELRDAPWGVEFTSGGFVPVVDDGSDGWGASVLPDGYTPESNWVPDSWSGGISGQRIRTMTHDEWVACGAPRVPGVHVHIQWRWTPLADCAFRNWINGPLTKVAEQHGAENVRVVMGFDS